MREIKLPSGAVLKIGVSPFEVSKALYQAILEEAKAVAFVSTTEMASVYKDIFCVGLSSKKIEACLWECFKKCIYNSGKGDLKIDKDTFEPVEARSDYVAVCIAVAKENIDPFVKGLYAEYSQFFEMIGSDQK
jgi:hypothetical protein